MEIIKYPKISRLGNYVLEKMKDIENEIIKTTVSEKIDGANVSVRVDELNNVTFWSRNIEVTKDNTLNGFFNWCMENVVPIKKELKPNTIYYGEWLTKHRVKYPEERYKNFYFFNEYDIERDIFSEDSLFPEIIEKCRVPIKYEKKGCSTYEDIINCYNKMEKESEGFIEGVVIKWYTDSYMLMSKLINTKLLNNPPVKEKWIVRQDFDEETNIFLEKVSMSYIHKQILKMLDEKLMEEVELDLRNMSFLIKRVSEYCKKDAVSELNVCIDINKKNITKIVSNRVAKTLKKIISEREIENDKSRQKF